VKLPRKLERLLTVYQNRRYDGDFQAIQQLVEAGTLGHIVRFETNLRPFPPQLKPGAWRETRQPGSGILFDIAPHLIDHALMLFCLPEAVTADVEPSANMPSRTMLSISRFTIQRACAPFFVPASLAAAPRPRFVLLGTLGSFVKQAFDPQEMNLRRGYIPEDKPWGDEPEENWGV